MSAWTLEQLLIVNPCNLATGPVELESSRHLLCTREMRQHRHLLKRKT